MDPLIDRLDRTLAKPIGGLARVALLAGAVLLAIALFVPLWRIHLVAQQFPEGLDLWIYPSRITGGNGGQDLHEINILNHYIGMKAIEAASFPEMKWLPFGIGAFVLVSLRAVVLGRLRTLVDTFVLFLYFGGFALGSFYWRLYTYGHNLDPAAPMEVAPFTPPVLGSQQLANFHVTSLPQAGGVVLAAYGLLLAALLVVEWRRQRGRLAPPGRAAGLVAAILATSAMGANAVAAATLEVGPNGYPSIGAAVTAAGRGDTVRVAAGTYREHIVVDRPIALAGEPGAVVDGGGEGSIVRVLADDVVLSGLVLRASGRSLERDDSAVLVTGRRAVVRGNVLEEVLHGVYLRGGGGATIDGNVIRGGAARSLSTRGDGIRVFDASGNTVTGNDVRDVRDGIYVQAAHDNAVARNVVRHARYGLHYMYADRNVFTENLFERNQVGASIMMSRGIALTRNTFAGNAGYVGYGVLLQDAQDVRVEGNRFVGNATGIFMDLAVRGRVGGNLVAGHQVGIHVYPSSEDNLFVGNVFSSNVADVYTGRGGRGDRWAEEGGAGNFWAGAGTYDLDGDGVGDAPHRTGSLVTHLAESLPQLRLFLFSPAVRMLDLAERAAPVFGVPEVVDPRPLARPPATAGAAAPLPSRDGTEGSWLLGAGLLLAGVGLAGLAAGAAR